MLVTRSSPDLAGVVLTVPSSWPALFTDSTSVPGVPSSCVLYCSSSPAWPTRPSPAKPAVGRRACFPSLPAARTPPPRARGGEAGRRQALLLHLRPGDRAQVPEGLRRVGAVRLRVAGDRLHSRGDRREVLVILHA